MFATLRSPVAALRRHLKTRTRGQSLVELALILPVFMLFFAAVLDLGRIAAAQVAVQNAAREGAFQAAETPTSFDSTTGCPVGAATNKVYCRVKLESSGGVTINPSDVSVTCNPIDCSTGLGNTVTVVVNGHFRLLTPLMGAFFGGNQNVTFTASSVQNRETLPVSGTSPSGTASPSPSASSSSSASASPSASSGCALPSAGFTYTYSSANKKAPQAITFTDTSTSVVGCAIDNWEWTATDSAGTTMWTSTQQNPGTFNYLLAGSYFVQLRVHNATGSWVSTGAVQIIVK
jgi:Flp pilus assembly protein TadG